MAHLRIPWINSGHASAACYTPPGANLCAVLDIYGFFSAKRAMFKHQIPMRFPYYNNFFLPAPGEYFVIPFHSSSFLPGICRPGWALLYGLCLQLVQGSRCQLVVVLLAISHFVMQYSVHCRQLAWPPFTTAPQNLHVDWAFTSQPPARFFLPSGLRPFRFSSC